MLSKHPLSLHQKSMHYIYQETPHNLMIALDIWPLLDDFFILKSIEHLYDYYPILRAIISSEKDDLFFKLDPIDHELPAILTIENEQNYVNTILNTNLEQLLLRIYIIKKKEDIKVIFLFNHVIVDKHSAHTIINKFLYFLDRRTLKKEPHIPLNKQWRLVPPVESLFPDFVRNTIETKNCELFKEAKKSEVLSLCFDKNILERFKEIKKGTDLSIHKIMSISGLLTIKDYIDAESYICTHLTDLRRHFFSDEKELISSGLGVLSASFNTTHQKKEIFLSKKTAKLLSESINMKLASIFFLEELTFLSSVLDKINKNTNLFTILNFLQFSDPSVCISSLGKINLYQPTTYQLKHYFNAVTTHPFCGTKNRFLVLNYSHNDSFYINIVAPTPAWSKEELKLLGQQFSKNLYTLIDKFTAV